MGVVLDIFRTPRLEASGYPLGSTDCILVSGTEDITPSLLVRLRLSRLLTKDRSNKISALRGIFNHLRLPLSPDLIRLDVLVPLASLQDAVSTRAT